MSQQEPPRKRVKLTDEEWDNTINAISQAKQENGTREGMKTIRKAATKCPLCPDMKNDGDANSSQK